MVKVSVCNLVKQTDLSSRSESGPELLAKRMKKQDTHSAIRDGTSGCPLPLLFNANQTSSMYRVEGSTNVSSRVNVTPIGTPDNIHRIHSRTRLLSVSTNASAN